MGIVAEKQSHWEQAEEYCREALTLFIDFDDHHWQAATYQQLGRIAETRGESAEALSLYLKALAMSLVLEDLHSLAATLGNLKRLRKAAPSLDVPAYIDETLQNHPGPNGPATAYSLINRAVISARDD